MSFREPLIVIPDAVRAMLATVANGRCHTCGSEIPEPMPHKLGRPRVKFCTLECQLDRWGGKGGHHRTEPLPEGPRLEVLCIQPNHRFSNYERSSVHITIDGDKSLCGFIAVAPASLVEPERHRCRRCAYLNWKFTAHA